MFKPKFRPRRLWRRTESIGKRLLRSQKIDWYFEEMTSVHVSSGGSRTCHFHNSHVGPKSAKLGSFGAPSSPGGLIVQPKS